MTSERDLKLVLSVAAILFIVGLFCYAAFPSKPPDNPIRIQYRSATGSVLFQHAQHVNDFDVSCFDCHHHYVEEEEVAVACGECHLKELEEGAPPPEKCLECHGEDEIEDSVIPAKTDAFHSQCADCHRNIGVGPLKKACAECHVQ